MTITYHKDDPCPKECGGYLFVRTTHSYVSNGLRTRYFECRNCGHECNCDVPAESVAKRTIRASRQSSARAS